MQETLSHYFGYDTFRPGQEEIISKIIDHRNVLGVLPTGGKQWGLMLHLLIVA